MFAPIFEIVKLNVSLLPLKLFGLFGLTIMLKREVPL